MIDVIILTGSSKGFASYQLQQLKESNLINVKAVVLSRNEISNKKRHYKRKLKKALKIGILGTLNGIRIRKWYKKGVAEYLNLESIESVCKTFQIPYFETPTVNCKQTIQYFMEINADLGLSLGNGYIGSKVFSIPRLGMINVHHEELPAYQNAQSIIWQIYNQSPYTGFTIHKIDKRIDTGEIIYQEKIPIDFKETLEETVSYNYAKLWKESSIGLIKILENFDHYFQNGKPQGQGNSYTTPSFSQFLKIKRNFRKLKSKI